MQWVRRYERWILIVLLLASCVCAVHGLDRGVLSDGGSQDNQWGPSRALLEHRDPFAAYLASPGHSPFFLSQSPNYFASGLVLLWPFAVFDWPVAKVLWACANLLFTVGIFLCLFRLLPSDTPSATKVLLVTLMLTGTPWRNVLANGQHSLFTLFFFLLAVVLSTRSTIGASWALAAAFFKHTISFPLALFFARSCATWRPLLIAGAIHVALTLFAAAWSHASPLDLLTGPVKVAQFATGRGHLDVFAIATVLGISSKAVPAAAALLILMGSFLSIRRDADTLSCLSTLALASMAVVFHLMYDFVVLVIPLCYALRGVQGGSRLRVTNYLLVVGMVWFVDKFVEALVGLVDGPVETAENLMFWLTVVVFYGTLFTDWWLAFRSRQRTPGGVSAGSSALSGPSPASRDHRDCLHRL